MEGLRGLWKIKSREDVEKIAYGASFLGGGGGGSVEEGLKLGMLALEMSPITVLDVEELEPESRIATASTVGSQVEGREVLKPYNYIESLELLKREIGELGGVISSENGGLNTFTSWIQASTLGLPVVDAPCDGRAHPTALMGSLGLHRLENYTSIQAFSVGTPRESKRISGVVKGSLEDTSKVVRSIASIYGAVAVARNPVNRDYLAENGARGALRLAFELGEIIVKVGEGLEVAYKLCDKLQGRVIGVCRVEDVKLEVRGGFDVGYAKLKCGSRSYQLTFVNEYMTLESNGERLATFPDLISLLRLEDGKPFLSSDLKTGMEACLVIVGWENIPLGSGLKYGEVYKPIEEVLNKPILGYVKDLLLG